MALSKNANAVIHPSFAKIQTSTLHEMDQDQAGGEA
jgi:hypothetical protein